MEMAIDSDSRKRGKAKQVAVSCMLIQIWPGPGPRGGWLAVFMYHGIASLITS